jgi:hypothetical protein
MEQQTRNLSLQQREATVPPNQENAPPSLPTQMPQSFQAKEALRNSTAARNNSVRAVSYIDLDDDESEVVERPPSSSISSSPSSASDRKRSGRNSSDYHSKKPRTTGLPEVIDLTYSPPQETSRPYGHAFSARSPSPPSSGTLPGPYPRTQLFADAQCSDEQQRILDLVSQGRNVFFTGSAGVGKSFVLNKISELFKSQGLEQFEDFFVTASTGTLSLPRPAVLYRASAANVWW